MSEGVARLLEASSKAKCCIFSAGGVGVAAVRDCLFCCLDRVIDLPLFLLVFKSLFIER